MKKTIGSTKQKGVTLIELMVAVLIGMLAMYAVYRVYDGTERTKRAITSVGDAQISGLYSTFLLEESIQNAGSGLMFNKLNSGTGVGLINCPDDPIGAPGTPSATPKTLSLKPLPVIIDPTADSNFDDIYVFAGRSPRHIRPLTVNGTTANTPFGFAQGTVLVGIQAGVCIPYLVTADIAAQPAGAPIDTNVQGAGSAPPPNGTTLVDLGIPSRVRFYVDDENTLQMEVWNVDARWPGQWVRARTDPIISGVMLLKAQYGIDATVTATNPGTGVTNWIDAADPGWDMTSLQGTASTVTVNQIKAIRLALIVRADEPENSATFDQATKFKVFQNCPVGTCGDPIDVIFAARTGPGKTTYRYRMYEKVIPLRNTLYNL